MEIARLRKEVLNLQQELQAAGQVEIARLRKEVLNLQQELQVAGQSNVNKRPRKVREVRPFDPESSFPPWLGDGFGLAMTSKLDSAMNRWAVLDILQKEKYWSKWAECKRAGIDFDTTNYTTEVDAKYSNMLDNKIKELLQLVPAEDLQFETSCKNFIRFVERAVEFNHFEYLIDLKSDHILSALNTYIVTDESGDQEEKCIEFQDFIEKTGYDSVIF